MEVSLFLMIFTVIDTTVHIYKLYFYYHDDILFSQYITLKFLLKRSRILDWGDDVSYILIFASY